ncbi:hypothetical protein KEM56_000584 [Ascosphaera pollenicola]|nr:hypothetical protein KEM56_000584 [Ascosphaera pollenicola]
MDSDSDVEERSSDVAMEDAQHDENLDAKYAVNKFLAAWLFKPLNENKKKPSGSKLARRKLGPEHHHLNPQERRRDIVSRFISKWRQEVGNDVYPAFRLIIPDRDRDRGMYGLKEKTVAKLLIKVMKINRDSEDGQMLMNWKLPGRGTSSAMSGDFAGRCYEVISKRPLRVEFGDMTIDDVNDALDRLSVASKENEQLPIFREFYQRMSPEELMWLIRIILRQMKIGATERTFFGIWHPDAENLFSVSSSLRRVCWELWDPNVRLEGDEAAVTLMQCFQPQLAQFQMHNFERMIARMRLDPENSVFWIEEKMDGERMQLHMCSDSSVEGGKRFKFWSRKAKDYTYLYGDGSYDDNGSLTRHLKDAFADGVDSIILDGEMITWDPEQDAPVPFGTLKTAALREQRNPFEAGHRPLLRIFDILYLNGKALTRYTLRDRRRALDASIRPVHRRFEIHPYEEGRKASDIEPLLRRVVAEASEGLILKNPNSPYRLNERSDDWMKVKPEYMTEFGESLDLIVIGGYYGSGRRGGHLSSFLCGLRVDKSPSSENSQKCYSFCKVGGGFAAQDYATLRHRTDGKWKDWNPKKPPTEFIELGGGTAQHERPDMWIKPEDSIVLCVKAAQVVASDMFRIGLTLRFPRLKMLRPDKDWKTALSVDEFMQLKSNIEQEQKEKEFKVEDTRKRRVAARPKKELTVAGDSKKDTVEFKPPSGQLFTGLNFCILTERSAKPKKTKSELEKLVKSNQGKIFQTNTAADEMYCIADRRTVKVASIQKNGKQNVIQPEWLLDCIKQAEVDEHLGDLTNKFSDSYTRDVEVKELAEASFILESMPLENDVFANLQDSEAEILNTDLADGFPGLMLKNCHIYFAPHRDAKVISERLQLARNVAAFAGARIAQSSGDQGVTQIVIDENRELTDVTGLRKEVAERVKEGTSKLPRIVSVRWIEDSWKEKTILDEEKQIKTVTTDLLGINHPVLLAGMNVAAGPKLAAAVTNAGGCGVIGGMGYTPEMLREQIAELKKHLVDKNAPFGVDLLLPQVGGNARKTNYDYTKGKLNELVNVMIEEKTTLFVCAVGVPPKEVVERLHKAGILYMNMIGHPKHVKKCLALGVDLICAQGGEGGGHTGHVPTSVLIPAVVKACQGHASPLTGKPVQVIAAGGVYSGETVASALMLGASAVWVGTRFILAEEAGAPKEHQEAVQTAGFDDSVRTIIFTGRPLRVKNNAYIHNWEENKHAEIKELTSKGIIPVEHDLENIPDDADDETLDSFRPWLMGNAAAAIEEIKPAKAIVDELVDGAVASIKKGQNYLTKGSKL